MSIGIYGFFDKNTNECLYVGQSIELNKRKMRHISKLKNGSHTRNEFNQWFLDYGEECLDYKVLETCSTEDLNKLEVKYFEELSPKFYGHVPSLNNSFTVSIRTRSKISETLSRIKYKEPRRVPCDNCGKIFETRRSHVKNCSTNCSSSRLKPSEVDEIVRLHLEEKLSLTKIGSKFGVSKIAVRNRLINLGVYRGKQN